MMISNGILSVDDEGGVRDPGDIQKQTRNVLANVEHLLKEFDMEVLDVAQSQVTLTDFRDYDAYNALYRNFFAFPFPARNSVEAGLGKISHYGLKYQIEGYGDPQCLDGGAGRDGRGQLLLQAHRIGRQSVNRRSNSTWQGTCPRVNLAGANLISGENLRDKIVRAPCARL